MAKYLGQQLFVCLFLSDARNCRHHPLFPGLEENLRSKGNNDQTGRLLAHVPATYIVHHPGSGR